MGIDWEYIGEGISEIAGMVSNTIMDKYSQEQAERRFMSRYKSMLEMKDPYEDKASKRRIAEQLAITRNTMQEQKGFVKWQTEYGNEMQTYFHSEELMKKVEKAMTSDKEEEILWFKNWQRVSGKVRRYEDLEQTDEDFIESLNSIARANINNTRLQKDNRDKKHDQVIQQSKEATLRLEAYLGKTGFGVDEKRYEMEQELSGYAAGIATERANLDREIEELDFSIPSGGIFEKNKAGIWDGEGNIIPERKAKLLEHKGYLKSSFDRIAEYERLHMDAQARYERYFPAEGLTNEQDAVKKRTTKPRSVNVESFNKAKKYKEGSTHYIIDPDNRKKKIKVIVKNGKLVELK